MHTYVTNRIWQIRGTKVYGDEEVDFLIMCCRSLELAEMYLQNCPDKNLYIDTTYELVSIRDENHERVVKYFEDEAKERAAEISNYFWGDPSRPRQGLKPLTQDIIGNPIRIENAPETSK
jgi:hypothetical protein